ncbi:hypothetical protein HN51_022632 [Arachis hypogaea]
MLQVLLSLSFDEDLGIINIEASNQFPDNDRKRSKHELIAKTKEEVEADYKVASFALYVMERR